MEEMQSVRYGDAWSFYALSGHTTLPARDVFNLEALQTPLCRDLLCSFDWLCHWPLVINSMSSPFFSSPEVRGGAESFQTSTAVPLATSSHQEGI